MKKRKPTRRKRRAPKAAVVDPAPVEADAVFATFVADGGYDIAIVWADRATPVTCVFLRVNNVTIDHDHLLRAPHGYRLPPPIDGLYAVDWGLTPQMALAGPLTIGIANRDTGKKVVVGSVADQGREEWAGNKVVDAP